MRSNLLARLRRNGVLYIAGALLLLVGLPLYQAFVLNPRGYNNTFSVSGVGHITASLVWIGAYPLQFIVYHLLLALAFVLLLSLPFTLFRIIVAQEIMAQQEAEDAAVDVEEALPEQEADKQKVESAMNVEKIEAQEGEITQEAQDEGETGGGQAPSLLSERMYGSYH